jgi:ABC-2 type transport system ATP-binding protein
VTGFLGPDGAGRWSTIRMMVGVDAPTSVRVTTAITTCASRCSTSVPSLEATAIHPGRSPRNHLLGPTGPNGTDRRRVAHVLALVGLAEVAHALRWRLARDAAPSGSRCARSARRCGPLPRPSR